MPDINGLLSGGFPVVVLVLFLVQAFREAFPAVDSRYLPLVSLLAGGGLVSLNNFAPPAVVTTVATGIAVGAAASLSVRYVKNGDSGSSAEPVTLQSGFIQGSVEHTAASPVESLPALPVKEAPVSFPYGVSHRVGLDQWRGNPKKDVPEANPRGDEPRLQEAQPRVTVTMPPTK